MSYTTYDFNTPMIHFQESKYNVNTISNIFYLASGVRLLDDGIGLGKYMFYIGIFSTLFHGTDLLIFEIADELSILIMVHAILKKTNYGNWNFVYPLYLIGVYYKDFRVFYLILTSMSVTAIVELRRISIKNESYGHFKKMMIFFVVAKIFWIAEQTKPGYWHGHAIWHMYSSLVLENACKIVS